MKNSMLKLFLAVFLVPITAVPVGSTYPDDTSDRCKYNPDAPPKQMAGSKADAEYDFAYVSDYEHDDQSYRSRICNSTKHRVWFDWKLTTLSGWADTGGIVRNQLSYPEDPQVSDGPLKYDFKEAPTTGYKYKPIRTKKTGGLLRSILSGFVLSGDKLVPVEVRVISSYEANHYAYQISNPSQIAVQIWWKEFFVFWRERHRKEYGDQFQTQQKQGIWAASANEEKLILNPGKEAKWLFEDVGSTAEARTLNLQLYSMDRNPNPEKPDLSGLASVYLPEGPPAIARLQ